MSRKLLPYVIGISLSHPSNCERSSMDVVCIWQLERTDELDADRAADQFRNDATPIFQPTFHDVHRHT
jgi:hypothetical protein